MRLLCCVVADGVGKLFDKGRKVGGVALVLEKLLELVQNNDGRLAGKGGANAEEVL